MAELTPMGSNHILTLVIRNPGPADRLISVWNGQAASSDLRPNPNLAIPANSAPALSMDGAFGILGGMTVLTEGRLVPVTLTFQRAGSVTTRARVVTRVVTGTEMTHSSGYDVPTGEAQPSLALSVKPDGESWQVLAETHDFAFSKDAADGPHQAGTGHAHLYLNGLKLQRMYTPEARIGALPDGQHEIRVTLNTNDHRAYLVNGAPVTASVNITAD
ncbi:MAG: hypothetical protein LJE68_11710 [Rhodobacter sp.]|nr:hypothetical protein [Rhodobacter sp.]